MKTREHIKTVEAATLKTFQQEIPSKYFSDKTEAEFQEYSANAGYTYRELFKFPPKMFQGAELIDFGAGTGENTISLARWGAKCTLVEMNGDALAIARGVFAKYANSGEHRFFHSSIFDYESDETYDIVHCRGVLSHTADKEGAFRKISKFLKPGGFLIFGDPNKAGGFQNMLQRYAVYRLAKDVEGMVEVCEQLFKEDIDRSQSFVPRTRRAIIFDRWVIQSQDDPSVAQVLEWMEQNGLRLYSAYPPYLMPLQGDSVHHRPKFPFANTPGMAAVAETIWMLQRFGDSENVECLDADYQNYATALQELTEYVENVNSETKLDSGRLLKLADAAADSFLNVSLLRGLQHRFGAFIKEVRGFVELVERANIDELRTYIQGCEHLFKGAVGVRHVDFIAYKPE